MQTQRPFSQPPAGTAIAVARAGLATRTRTVIVPAAQSTNRPQARRRHTRARASTHPLTCPPTQRLQEEVELNSGIASFYDESSG